MIIIERVAYISSIIMCFVTLGAILNRYCYAMDYFESWMDNLSVDMIQIGILILSHVIIVGIDPVIGFVVSLILLKNYLYYIKHKYFKYIKWFIEFNMFVIYSMIIIKYF